MVPLGCLELPGHIASSWGEASKKPAMPPTKTVKISAGQLASAGPFFDQTGPWSAANLEKRYRSWWTIRSPRLVHGAL
jgi:hypothetical protein